MPRLSLFPVLFLAAIGSFAVEPAADAALSREPVSVTQKTVVAPSGNPHDYASTAPYFWPDPAKPDGLPYIRRDGEIFPGSRTDASDYERAGDMSRTVATLTRAYTATGEERFAAHAARFLRTWFIDPATAMTPHLEYAQGIPGVNTGRQIGIIEGGSFVSAFENAARLVDSAAWTDTDHAALMQWADSFLTWYLTSPFGIKEAAGRNNHGTHYDVQVIRMALVLGRTDLALEVAETAKTRRIAAQIEPDGSQPLELERTAALTYSIMNLRGMIHLAELGEQVDVDLWHFETADGRSIRRAIDFLIPYIVAPAKPWPYQQIKAFHPSSFASLLQQAAIAYNEPAYAAMAQTLSPPDSTRTTPPRPNVLFIAIDDLRPELGCYGDTQVKSPNIDRLAAEGLVFQRAYCQVPVCGASRASLMTSVLPTPDRYRIARTRVDEDAPGTVTLPQVFKENGYTTISNGKIFHFGDDTSERSWTKRAGAGQSHSTNLDPTARTTGGKPRMYESPDVPDNAYGDGKVAENTIADLRTLKAAGEPFFLACGFIRPHMPFYAPKKYWDLYNREEINIADNRDRPENAPAGLKGSNEFRSYDFGDYKEGTEDFHRMMRHGYYASTSFADKLVGDVLAELDRLGLADNTIVIIWGDHGWNLGEHEFWGKHNTLDTSVRVPLIMKVPGKAAGHASSALVGVYDLFPTLCSLADLPVPSSVQGRSFAPLLDNPSQAFRDAVYTRYGKGDAIVTDHFIYTNYGEDGEMLYDHRSDPAENHNLSASPAYHDQLLTMRALLQAHQDLAARANVAAPVEGTRGRPD